MLSLGLLTWVGPGSSWVWTESVLLHLHLQSGLDLYQKFDIIIAPDTPTVCHNPYKSGLVLNQKFDIIVAPDALSVCHSSYKSSTAFYLFLFVSDDVKWNASHSYPYFIAELSAAGICGGMVRCKCGIWHPAWAQPPKQINLCMCKWPLCLERFSTAGRVLASDVECKCATNVVSVQFNVPVFIGAIKQQTPEVSMQLPESVNGGWHCMWMYYIPYFNCKVLYKFPIIVYAGKCLYMQNLTISGF